MSDSAGGGPANGRQVTGPAWCAPKRWIYRSGRPGRAAKAMNAFTAALYPNGVLSPSRGISLQVRGRQSGKPVSLPVVVADRKGSRYLVSMLGSGAN